MASNKVVEVVTSPVKKGIEVYNYKQKNRPTTLIDENDTILDKGRKVIWKTADALKGIGAGAAHPFVKAYGGAKNYIDGIVQGRNSKQLVKEGAADNNKNEKIEQ